MLVFLACFVYLSLRSLLTAFVRDSKLADSSHITNSLRTLGIFMCVALPTASAMMAFLLFAAGVHLTESREQQLPKEPPPSSLPISGVGVYSTGVILAGALWWFSFPRTKLATTTQAPSSPINHVRSSNNR